MNQQLDLDSDTIRGLLKALDAYQRITQLRAMISAEELGRLVLADQSGGLAAQLASKFAFVAGVCEARGLIPFMLNHANKGAKFGVDLEDMEKMIEDLEAQYAKLHLRDQWTQADMAEARMRGWELKDGRISFISPLPRPHAASQRFMDETILGDPLVAKAVRITCVS